MFASINIILGLILVILTVVIVVKKILIGFKGTDSGIYILILAVLCLVGLFCSFSALFGAFTIQDASAALDRAKTISSDDIASVNKEISKLKTSNTIYLIVGYASLFFNFIVCKFIDRKNKELQEKNKKRVSWKDIF